MRRFVSMLFILLCWLGPLSALAPGSDESQLPACCRRHGAHHCAMSQDSEQMPAQASGGAHLFSAPAHCPRFHHGSPASTGVFTVPVAPAPALAAGATLRIAAARQRALHEARTNAGRGPPAAV